MNRISEILQERQIEDMAPNDQLLQEMEIKIHTWNKWVGNKKDPEFFQIPIISKFLGCEIEDLFPRAALQSVTSKHGLINA